MEGREDWWRAFAFFGEEGGVGWDCGEVFGVCGSSRDVGTWGLPRKRWVIY